MHYSHEPSKDGCRKTTDKFDEWARSNLPTYSASDPGTMDLFIRNVPVAATSRHVEGIFCGPLADHGIAHFHAQKLGEGYAFTTACSPSIQLT